MSVFQHPEYLAAVASERDERDAAFLGVSEDIAGFESRPLTLWPGLTLRLMRSPLLSGGTPSPTELAAFLWCVSVDYRPDTRARQAFLQRCRGFLPKLGGWRFKARSDSRLAYAAVIVNAARAYINRAFADFPEPGPEARNRPEYFSDFASIAALLARDYAIPADRCLQVTVRQYAQFLNRSNYASNSKAVFWNPSDKILARLTAELNAKNAAAFAERGCVADQPQPCPEPVVVAAPVAPAESHEVGTADKNAKPEVALPSESNFVPVLVAAPRESAAELKAPNSPTDLPSVESLMPCSKKS